MTGPPKKRSPRLTREQRPSAILRMARAMFRVNGYEGTTVSEIAAGLLASLVDRVELALENRRAASP